MVMKGEIAFAARLAMDDEQDVGGSWGGDSSDGGGGDWGTDFTGGGGTLQDQAPSHHRRIPTEMPFQDSGMSQGQVRPQRVGPQQPFQGSGAQVMVPPPLPEPFSQADHIQLQRLQQGLSAAQGQVDEGMLHPQEGQQLKQQILKMMQPLQSRKQRAETQAQQQAKHQLLDQEATQFSIQQIHGQKVAQGFQGTVAEHVDPMTGLTTYFYQHEPGKWKPLVNDQDEARKDRHKDYTSLLDEPLPPGVSMRAIPSDMRAPGLPSANEPSVPSPGGIPQAPGQAPSSQAPVEPGGSGVPPAEEVAAKKGLMKNAQGQWYNADTGHVLSPQESDDAFAAANPNLKKNASGQWYNPGDWPTGYVPGGDRAENRMQGFVDRGPSAQWLAQDRGGPFGTGQQPPPLSPPQMSEIMKRVKSILPDIPPPHGPLGPRQAAHYQHLVQQRTAQQGAMASHFASEEFKRQQLETAQAALTEREESRQAGRERLVEQKEKNKEDTALWDKTLKHFVKQVEDERKTREGLGQKGGTAHEDFQSEESRFALAKQRATAHMKELLPDWVPPSERKRAQPAPAAAPAPPPAPVGPPAFTPAQGITNKTLADMLRDAQKRRKGE